MPTSLPLTVAVIGASADRSKFGNKSVRAHLVAGYRVFPVHPKADLIEGLPVFRSAKDVPVERLDRATIYLPPALGLAILDELAAASPREVWFNPGSATEELLRLARERELNAIAGCSILSLGLSPAEFADGQDY
jgi:predicted CoA-binding protein